MKGWQLWCLEGFRSLSFSSLQVRCSKKGTAMVHEPLSTLIVQNLISYSYYYPFFMAYIWMIGTIYYYFLWERNRKITQVPHFEEYPLVSILIPCHNEEKHIERCIKSLNKVANQIFIVDSFISIF